MCSSDLFPSHDKLLKVQSPDMVLLDLGLGGSTTIGVEICSSLRKNYPDMKVLIFTGEVLNEKLWVDALNAEYYYQEGVKVQNSNDLSKAIAMYEESRKWIPDYKDCMSRIYTLRIGGKIDELAKNLAVTQTEFEKMQNRVNSVSPAVDKSVDIMDKVTYVSDKTRDLNEVMKSTSTTLKVFKIIPTVGTATGILARSIDLGQEPVGKVAQKFSMIEQPIITPTKNVVGKAKGVVDNVKGKMETTTNVLKTTSAPSPENP